MQSQSNLSSGEHMNVLTVSEAASIVGVHEVTFLRWIHAKRVTGVKKHGTTYIVDPDFTILVRYSKAFLKRARAA